MNKNPQIKSFRKLQITSILFGVFGLAAFLASKFANGRLIVILTVTGLIGFLVTAGILAVKIRQFWRAFGTLALDLLLAVAGAYLLMFFTLLFFQDTIADNTSTFFQPSTLSARSRAGGSDGKCGGAPHHRTGWRAALNGWLVDNADSNPSPLVIVFNGSGSESSQMIPYAEKAGRLEGGAGQLPGVWHKRGHTRQAEGAG